MRRIPDLTLEDAEFLKAYGLRKADRLKLEAASKRLFDASARHESRLLLLHGVDSLPPQYLNRIDLSGIEEADTANELYDAALNYASVKLYISTVCFSPMECEEICAKLGG